MAMKTGYKVGIGLAVIAGGYFAYRKFSGYLSAKGKKFLQHAEGYKLYVYPDSKGLPTAGLGHLLTAEDYKILKATPATVIGKKITKAQADKWEKKDLDWAQRAVKDSIKVPLKQYQKDALVNMAFNIGNTGFRTSTLVKKINAKAPREEIIREFSKWDNPSEIVERRIKEVRLYFTGNYSTADPTKSEIQTFYKP